MRVGVPLILAGAALLPVVSLAGCGHSPATTFLTIDPAPPPAAAQMAYRGAPLRVPFVHVPVTLDRPEFVSQPSPGTLKVADFARWSAPLGGLARDTLIRDLTARLPAGSVLAPDAAPVKPEVVIQVTVLDFTPADGGAGTTATMTVSYRVGPTPAPRVVQLQAPLAGPTPVDAAQAWSALIGQLADRIVGDLPAG